MKKMLLALLLAAPITAMADNQHPAATMFDQAAAQLIKDCYPLVSQREKVRSCMLKNRDDVMGKLKAFSRAEPQPPEASSKQITASAKGYADAIKGLGNLLKQQK